MALNGLKKSRRAVKEPGWMNACVRGKKGKTIEKG